MFKHKYLTMRFTPSERGLEFKPNWQGDCEIDTGCPACTDGCTNCSGDCTGCTATCRGADSTGALLPNDHGDVELILDLTALEKVLKSAERLLK
ncbi:MAG: hypothetical protein ABL971_05345 [Vicinamibacterales bacterium]